MVWFGVWPSLFWCIRDPLDIFWLGGVKVRILFGKDGVIYHIQKDSYALVRVFALMFKISHSQMLGKVESGLPAKI